ncbi:MAG: methylenetetrahydrofolate--tRNA-(uracil(54)-C(5))-methyltransferase (FADH(2)-oxidizing) TrmFO [Clostridia bacterium]|nr:methylenetetrahydrofolate--tRNA-(uracil(54)-C(5))-methyltransferase (FADH(2)-oxidizing) TrmFO [Clostridia bacterium]
MINVVGAGLAGCEAAYQISKLGGKVRLYEMKPGRKSPAHSKDYFAELVCSNSLRASALTNAVGLLKEEMRRIGSLVMTAADRAAVPAGASLAVDRDMFSGYITEVLRNDKNIEIIEAEINSLSELEGVTVIATGPLTSGALYEDIMKLTGDQLHFFDAAAPIVTKDCINMDKCFFMSRWGKGDDYLNCPMTKEEYDIFYTNLIGAECAELSGFEDDSVFEGCLPVEVMAKRGYETLLYGPLKPVGLTDPRTGKRPYACVQLRKEDSEGTMFNIVGFQTHLRFPEQKRVFSLIPGLEDIRIIRYGVMHRNSYINSPGILDRNYRLISNNDIFFAGQMTGVEGYLESAASGLYAGISAFAQAHGTDMPYLSSKTAVGALAAYISSWKGSDFQPMNVNFGIMDPLEERIKNKKDKNLKIAERSLEEIGDFTGRRKI